MTTFTSATSTVKFLALCALFISCSASVVSYEVEHESGDDLPQASMAVAAPKVLKLERESIILPKTSEHPARRKNFYSAKIQVGEPAQEFHVAFDLGGGTVILPSKTCKDKACLERRRYDRWISDTAEDIQANGQLVNRNHQKTRLRRRDHGTLDANSVDMGSGKVSGFFVRDQVCVRGEGDEVEDDPRCFPLAMLVASDMSSTPFALEPYDGTVGLGLSGMSVSKEFNFLTAYHDGEETKPDNRFPNSFGLHIGSGEDGGEITFGGYDIKRLTHPLKWVPVAAPEDGRWQVSITAIRMGNNTIEACKERACLAAIDYSASLLGVPSKLSSGLERMIAKLAPPSGFGDGCQLLSIPDLTLTLSNDVTLTLPAEDFVSGFGARKGAASCEPLLTHSTSPNVEADLGQDMFILGESTLRRYYTFFNADTLSVGFSLAAKSAGKGKALPGGKKAGDIEEDDENPVILLVQVVLKKSKTVSSLGL